MDGVLPGAAFTYFNEHVDGGSWKKQHQICHRIERCRWERGTRDQLRCVLSPEGGAISLVGLSFGERYAEALRSGLKGKKSTELIPFCFWRGEGKTVEAAILNPCVWSQTLGLVNDLTGSQTALSWGKSVPPCPQEPPRIQDARIRQGRSRWVTTPRSGAGKRERSQHTGSTSFLFLPKKYFQCQGFNCLCSLEVKKEGVELGWFRRKIRKKAGKKKGSIYLVPKQKNAEKLCSGFGLLLCPLWVSWTFQGNGNFPTKIDSDINQGKTLWARTVCKQMSTISLVFWAINNHTCMCAKSLQPCLTLCNSVDCGLPGSSVHGILQARILEWVAIPSSRGSSWPRDQTHISYISCIGRQVLYH